MAFSGRGSGSFGFDILASPEYGIKMDCTPTEVIQIRKIYKYNGHVRIEEVLQIKKT